MPENLNNTKKKVEQLSLFKDKKKWSFYFGAFTAIVVIVLVAGAIIPSISTIIRLSGEIREKKVLLDNLVAKGNDLEKLARAYEDNGDTFKDLPLLFPANSDYSLIMANLEAICLENGFQLTSINFEADSAPTSEVPTTVVLVHRSVTINVLGTPTNLIALLKAIEKMPMFPEILSTSYSNKADSTGKIAYSIEILLYSVEDKLFYD